MVDIVTQTTAGRKWAKQGEEHAQGGQDAKTLRRIEIDGCLELGTNAKTIEFQVHSFMPSSPP